MGISPSCYPTTFPTHATHGHFLHVFLKIFTSHVSHDIYPTNFSWHFSDMFLMDFPLNVSRGHSPHNILISYLIRAIYLTRSCSKILTQEDFGRIYHKDHFSNWPGELMEKSNRYLMLTSSVISPPNMNNICKGLKKIMQLW